MKLTSRAHRMDKPTKVAATAAWLGILLALGLLVFVDDKRWGSTALLFSVALGTVFAALEMRFPKAAAAATPEPRRKRLSDPPESLPVHPDTGLYLHWVFRERLDGEIARASRHGRKLSVVALEPADLLDDPTPESYARAARALRRALRAGDFPAQLDHQRFVILLPETDAAQALAAGMRVLATLRSASEPPTDWLGALVCYPDDGADADRLLDQASVALRKGRLQTGTNAGSEPEPEETGALDGATPRA